MSDGQTSATQSGIGGQEEILSALFAQLVMQQANMAMMLLGKVPHPETGQVVKDIDAARLFIDQLEMLEAKTKGNLTKEESALLKQSLMNLRLGFVEAVESPKSSGAPDKQELKRPPEQAASSTPPEEDEHRKKFTKKY
ncbi:MAG TPA: DUF1844 domain-containing protein [Candidatus Limnocylindrales bacterium]|jgi:hypothetical protein|nr:DUF1844 domain-containing protein [Candidatus Limnocylindrales bacterium]